MSPTRRVLSHWTLGITHTTHCGLCAVVYVARLGATLGEFMSAAGTPTAHFVAKE